MTPDESNAVSPEWERLMRRSFDVPDIVAQPVAVEAILYKMNGMLDDQDQHGPHTERPENPSIEELAYKIIVQAGSRGDFDPYLADLPLNTDPHHRPSPGQRTAVAARGQGHWESDPVFNAGRQLADDVLERVKTFLKHHPFEDGRGRPS